MALAVPIINMIGCTQAKAVVPKPNCCQVIDGDWNVVNIDPGTEGFFAHPDVATWSSDYGFITPSGLYTAPPYTISGFDQVTGKNADEEIVVILWVKPISGDAPTHFANVPDWFLDPKLRNETNTRSNAPGLTEWQQWIASDSQTIEFEENTLWPVATEEIIPEANVYELIGQDDVGQPVLVPATFTPVVDTQARRFPVRYGAYELDAPLPEKCDKKSIIKQGPWSRRATKGPWQPSGEIEVKIDGKYSKGLKDVFGIEMSVGAVWRGNLERRVIDYVQSRIEEKWTCENNVWKLVSRRKCTMTATGLETIPNWYAFIVQGYPIWGGPTNWTLPPNCMEMNKK